MKNSNVIDLSDAHVVTPPELSKRERKAVEVLLEEVELRTHLRWVWVEEWPSEGSAVVAVAPARLADRLPVGPTGGKAPGGGSAGAAEGYRIETDVDRRTVWVVGNDERGLLYGVGRLLRELSMEEHRVVLPAALSLETAPAYALRGHQIGYRDKVNSYDGWDLPQWDRYLRDLAIFGANAVEMIPPRSDDKPTSVHFPRPPLEILAGVSRIADEYGLDVWLWYPALDKDYSDPATVDFALREWAEVFRVMPRLDAVFVPGGDPGRTPPKLLLPMLEKQAAQLKTLHPSATWWISPQGFTADEMDDFLELLRGEGLEWLKGIVHGPWIHSSIAEFRERVPERFPIRNYPDITHNLSCQFPVPDWDIAFALTIGREPVNPRPFDQAAIFRFAQPGSIGFLAYNEGCHDDVNKCVWSSLGWDPEKPVVEILREYSRLFIGERYRDDFAQGLLALERNWRGPLAANRGVVTTLQQFRRMESDAGPWLLKNWRFLQGLYRAYYDAYVRTRLLYERDLEERAMDCLRGASRTGSLVALDEAERILDLAVTHPVASDLRTRVFQLAEALFQSDAHMQLSIRLYQGQEEVRGANLDGIDFPLNDRPWLKERFSAIRGTAEEAKRLREIESIVEWTNPGPGGFYDDMGSSVQQPHVVPGPGYAADPAFLKSPQHRYPYRKDPRPIRLSWRGYTGPLSDAPFSMRYDGLDSASRYRIRLVYSDMDPEVKVRLTANGKEVHPWMEKPAPRGPVEFELPEGAIENGELLLTWHREPGRGHSGIGCEISEIWVLKSS